MVRLAAPGDGAYMKPAWSRDGRQIAYTVHGELFLSPAASLRPRRVEGTDVEAFTWLPGNRLAYTKWEPGTGVVNSSVWVWEPGGSKRRVISGLGGARDMSASPDGARVAIVAEPEPMT